MVQACSSNAGKSYLAAGLCRLYADRGLRVIPFKGQNMSNNAGVTGSGGEIGRAQLLQAQAARVAPDARMNPVLVKPEPHGGSQVVVLGRVDPELSKEPWQARKARLWPVVRQSLHELLDDCDLLIIEGAGSPAEINLKSGDIVNMRVAREAEAAVLLAADIDRGGAFAHLLGTWHSLDCVERELLAGFVLNKFRGDPALLGSGPEWLAERTGVPLLGTVPYLPLPLPDEDAFSLEVESSPANFDATGSASVQSSSSRSASPPFTRSPSPRSQGPLLVAVVRLPHLSNFDEFDPLRQQEGIELRWVHEPSELDNADVVILPGSKAVAFDLAWLRARGLAGAIVGLAGGGTRIHGVCGGLQMLGTAIRDPLAVEGGASVDGLALLDLETEMAPEKTVRLSSAKLAGGQESLAGYEIHHGQSRPGPALEPFLEGGLGYRRGNVSGVYLHGLFEHPEFRERVLGRKDGEGDWAERVDEALDRLAAHLHRHLPGLDGVAYQRVAESRVHRRVLESRGRKCDAGNEGRHGRSERRRWGLYLVLGGARSGKSSYAEALARRLGREEVTYLATLEAGDDEMRRRVERHRRQRPVEWQTVEAGDDVVAAVGEATGRVLLLDCLSGLVGNVLLDAEQAAVQGDEDALEQAVMDEFERLFAALGAFPGDVIIVSNEVGGGVVPPTALGRRFRDALGRANQATAARAGTVVLLTAGLPSALKGWLPEIDQSATGSGRPDAGAGGGS